MAERIVSPAVFTNEIDQTFLTQGISQIGGAVVGPFSRGPAYAPTIVRTHAELEDLFGVPEGKYYQPFTAREYLTHQGVVTIVRVGALGGYKQDNALVIKAKVEDIPADLSGSLGSGSLDLAVGDESIIGVLANTLYEGVADSSGFEGSTIDNDTCVLYHDTESVDPETGETVSVGNLETTLYLRKTVRTEDEFTGETIETVQSLKDDFDSNYVFSINPKYPDILQNIFADILHFLLVLFRCNFV